MPEVVVVKAPLLTAEAAVVQPDPMGLVRQEATLVAVLVELEVLEILVPGAQVVPVPVVPGQMVVLAQNIRQLLEVQQVLVAAEVVAIRRAAGEEPMERVPEVAKVLLQLRAVMDLLSLPMRRTRLSSSRISVSKPLARRL
jgi:hypothetical protein